MTEFMIPYKSLSPKYLEDGKVKIERALVSVSDKTDLIPLVKILHEIGCEIISTGGTGRKISEAGIPYIDISKVTGNPEAFGGRMKTISFQIESALLFDRIKDAEEAESLGIDAIDMVVCNLYPFQKVMEAEADFETLIENIDIGGPTMLRAAAKNFKYVTVLTDASDYKDIIEELKNNEGHITYDTRKKLMRKTFNHTADYDAMIADEMNKQDGIVSKRLSFSNGQGLRYGENSHQTASYYREQNTPHSLYDMKVLHGKALSFNNLLDINGAIESVKALDKNRFGCSVIKHSNPCGLCESDEQRKALELAWNGDPVSAFGSIIAFNCPVEKNTVEFFGLDKDRSERKFVEVIIAPKFSEEALTYLQLHKNLRVIEYDVNAPSIHKDLRYFNGLLIEQDLDWQLYDKMEGVTDSSFDVEANKDLIEFGLKAISNIKSNSIALVRKKGNSFQLLGMGAGQPNRLIATKLCLEKAQENLRNEYQGDASGLEDYMQNEIGKAIMISDAFFPFEDNVELAATYGVKTITQPGGSIRDKHVVATCNDLGITMVMTGLRHFKH